MKPTHQVMVSVAAFIALVVLTGLWTTVNPAASLWLLTSMAYVIGLTGRFWLEWRFATPAKRGIWWQQLLRLLTSCVPIVVFAAFMVNALKIQGIHPVVCQLLALCVIAAGAYVVGWDSIVRWDAPIQSASSVCSVRPTRVPLLAVTVFVASLLLFNHIWARPFYSSLSHVGHDFALSGIGLLEGKYWIDSNGVMAGLFNPPWFTPAWCTGAAYYADPQSAFYSTLMLFALWFDPFFATYLSVLLFATIAYWGSYALARQVLRWDSPGAIVFAVLGMSNAFMPMRSATGEVGYQPLYLWTILAMALCWPKAHRGWRNESWPVISVCLCLTIWLQYAFAGVMVPVFLGTVLFCLVAVVCQRANLVSMTLRALLGAVLAIIVNASKLFESASLMRQFPRDFYSLPGFPAFTDTVLSVFYGLLVPSQWTAEFGMRRLAHLRYTALPHEWAMHFGLGATLLFAICSFTLAAKLKVAFSQTNKERGHVINEKLLAILTMLAISSIPLILLWDNEAIREVLKRIPILNSAVWPMRWIVIYLPATQFLLALPAVILIARYKGRAALFLSAIASAVIWLGPVTEPINYYTDPQMQNYDPKAVIRAFQRSLDDAPIPIAKIALPSNRELRLDRNDTMLSGASQGACYNPIYGYRLEAFPQPNRLQSGDAMATDSRGESLISNPACLVHPAENLCAPGDGFKLEIVEQRINAEKFLDRKPISWNRPKIGYLLGAVSQCAFWTLTALLAALSAATVSRIFRKCAHAQSSARATPQN